MYQLTTAENIYKAVLAGIKKESTAVMTPESFNRLINGDVINLWLGEKADAVDHNQRSIDLLRNLVKSADLSPETINEQKTFELPGDYYRLQNVTFRLKDKWVPAKRLSTDTMNMVFENPFRTPNDSRVYYFQETNKIVNYPENSKVDRAKIIYLSYPQPIIFDAVSGNHQDGNLTQDQNKEIVDIAVRIFIERVKEERYKTQIMEERLKMQSK